MAQAQWVVQSNSVLVTWYDESTQGTVIVPFQSTITLLTQKRMRSRQLLSATTSRSHKSPHSCNKESALQNSNTAWNSVPPPLLIESWLHSWDPHKNGVFAEAVFSNFGGWDCGGLFTYFAVLLTDFVVVDYIDVFGLHLYLSFGSCMLMLLVGFDILYLCLCWDCDFA